MQNKVSVGSKRTTSPQQLSNYLYETTFPGGCFFKAKTRSSEEVYSWTLLRSDAALLGSGGGGRGPEAEMGPWPRNNCRPLSASLFCLEASRVSVLHKSSFSSGSQRYNKPKLTEGTKPGTVNSGCDDKNSKHASLLPMDIKEAFFRITFVPESTNLS